MKVDPSFRNPVPLGAALFTVLHLKKQQQKKEADPSDPPGFDPDTLFFPVYRRIQFLRLLTKEIESKQLFPKKTRRKTLKVSQPRLLLLLFSSIK